MEGARSLHYLYTSKGEKRMKTSKLLFHVFSLLAVASMLAACGGGGATQAPATQGSESSGMDALVSAAKAEGTLTTIALPHDWCNYGAVIDGFKAKYGLAV